MKLQRLFAASIMLLTTLAPTAFAIDQVVLKNGDIVEGRILADVPNRHVDIQLINGTKKRYLQTDVASVERDVPSNLDRRMSGSDSETFFGVNLGGSLLNLTGATIQFNWGARFGVNTAQLGDFSKLAFSIAYNSSTYSDTTGAASATISELMIQPLFRKVANTGFYFGPEIGLLFASASISGATLGSTNRFNFGVLTGYDYYFTNSFSLGPEIHFTNVSEFSQFKFLMGGTFHF